MVRIYFPYSGVDSLRPRGHMNQFMYGDILNNNLPYYRSSNICMSCINIIIDITWKYILCHLNVFLKSCDKDKIFRQGCTVLIIIWIILTPTT